MDRFGLAEALVEAGAKAVFGDLLFGLGLPIPIKKLESPASLATLIAPIITLLPISLFYPTGDRQNESCPRFSQYFQEANMIAGDLHYIRRYMPLELAGKMIITNTVTRDDEELLKDRKIATLVTTTPEIGRTVLRHQYSGSGAATLAGKRPEAITAEDYSRILDEIGVEPRIKRLG